MKILRRNRSIPVMVGLASAICLGVALLVEPTEKTGESQKNSIAATSASQVRSFQELHGSKAHGFVGSSKCAACHTAEHRSYLLSAHSRAMSLVDSTSEPPDATYQHILSGREYQVKRTDGALWHSEKLLKHSDTTTTVDDELPLISVAQPVKYLVGSGRHSRTYLFEIDGFLMESPITFYQSTQKWNMSPGYNHPHHEGFERAGDFGCLICHIGQAEPVDGAEHRLSILETAIGCERCHGPGQEHVEKLQAKARVEPEPDASIIHPGRLSRDLSEAICAQCHLRGDATVVRRGRSLSDFQPGMMLTDIRIDYQLTKDSNAMKVVGHVDQMHASRCYQQSAKMTCTTCHDMHATDKDRPGPNLFRQKCLTCHKLDECGIALAQRAIREPDDNCVKCHMPQVATDIPHIAFTHHRIGIHNETESETESVTSEGRLVPFGNVSFSSDAEQQRCLALAYAELADKQKDLELARRYRAKSFQLLKGLETRGYTKGDGDSLAMFARFAWESQQPAVAEQYANAAMASPDLSIGPRVNSLLVAGDSLLQLRQSAESVPYFKKLVQLRRRSQDWYLLGIAQYQSGQKAVGIKSIEHAVEIQPFRADLHQTLAEMLREAGETVEADSHLSQALRLGSTP